MDAPVLDLLLCATYIGGPAFAMLNRDIDKLVGNVGLANEQLNGFKLAADAANGAGNILIGTALTLGAGFAYAAVQAAKFDQVKEHIELVTGATQKQTQAIQDQTLATAKLYGLDPTQMLQGTYNILSAGVSPQAFINENLTQLFGAAYKARSEANQGMDYGQFVLDMTHAAQSAGLGQQDYGQFLALSTFIENHSNLTTSSIADFLGRASPVLTQYGVSLRDQLLSAGTLGNMGFMGSAPGREFASGIQQLLSKSGQAELRKLGVNPNSLFGPGGSLMPPEAIAQLMAGRTAGLSPAARNQAFNALFGRVGERVWLPFMSGAGQQKFNQLGGQMPASAQAVTNLLQLASGLSNTVAGRFMSILSTIKDIAIVVGHQIEPVMLSWLGHIQALLDKFQKFVTLHPKFMPDLLKSLPAMFGTGVGLKALAPILTFLGEGGGAGGGMTNAGRIAEFIGGSASRLFGAGRGLVRGPMNAAKWLLPSAENPMGGNPIASLMGGLGKLGDTISGAPAKGMEKLLGLVTRLTGGEGFMGLLKNIGGLIPNVLELAAGFSEVLIPLLLIAGAVAIGVLAFTRYRQETMQVLGVIGKQLTPIIKMLGAMFQAAGQQIMAAWQKALPAIDKAMKPFLHDLPRIVPLLKLIGVAVGALVAVFLGLVVGIVKGFLTALPAIIGFYDAVVRLFGDLAKFVIDLVKAIFGKGGWGAVGNDLRAIGQDILDAIGNLVNMVLDSVKGFVSGIVGWFQWLWDKLTKHSIIPDMITDILTWFGKLPAQLVTSGENLVKGFIQGILNMAGSLASTLGGVVTNAIDSIPGGKQAAHFLHIPGFALGTLDAPGGMALVGERGPELVYLPQHSQVYPNGGGSQSGRATRSTSGMSTYHETRLIQSQRESRYTPQQPIAAGALRSQLDLQYRYMTQYTA